MGVGEEEKEMDHLLEVTGEQKERLWLCRH